MRALFQLYSKRLLGKGKKKKTTSSYPVPERRPGFSSQEASLSHGEQRGIITSLAGSGEAWGIRMGSWEKSKWEKGLICTSGLSPALTYCHIQKDDRVKRIALYFKSKGTIYAFCGRVFLRGHNLSERVLLQRCQHRKELGQTWHCL